MIDESLIASLGLADAELDALMSGAALNKGKGYMDSLLKEQKVELIPGKLIKGKVIGLAGDAVVIEVGLKSEGLIPKEEFEGTEVRVGDEIDVLLEEMENEEGLIGLSKRKADRMLAWQRIVDTTKEGDVVEGYVTKPIKGGMLMDIGVPVFLPSSQVDVRRSDGKDYLGKKIRAEIIKIDIERRNIVVSRRKLIETEREVAKKRLLETLSEGQIVQGTVKNIADFGAFVDLGGIDGLLHITDMSWSRINHPSELLRVDQKIEVKVLNIDKDKQEISLGMKQTEVNPWELVGEKYPPGTVIEGTVRNLANYGAFVEIEPGIDGLLHVSDMSWTKKVTHPNEVVKKGDTVRCVVLEVDKEKQRISLGVKQLTEDPWLNAIPEHYKPGMVIRGTVTKITNFGVFVELESDLEGLLHISELADHKVENPQDVVKAGEEIDVKILRVDRSDRKIGLSLKRAQWGDTSGADAGATGTDAPAGDAAPAKKGKASPAKGGMDSGHGAMGTDKIRFK